MAKKKKRCSRCRLWEGPPETGTSIPSWKRPRAGIVLKRGLGGHLLCQFCRAADSRHISSVRALGGKPTYNGKLISGRGYG